MRLAAMQPAFLPPAAYFRLFAATDMFVLLDDVQFNRRWYTHRQRLIRKDGTKDWLTLALAKMPQTALINEMRWADDYQERWVKDTKKFRNMAGIGAIPTRMTPLMFVTNFLLNSCTALNIPLHVVKSSDIGVPPELKGQDRMLFLCEHFKADTYVNSPGGRELYNVKDFAKRGIALKFLPETDDLTSIADWTGSEKVLREEIYGNL